MTFVNWRKIKIIKFGSSEMLPSVLFYEDGKILIGKKAKAKWMLYPKKAIKSSKVYMGDFEKKWEIKDKEFTPTDVAYEILKAIKNKVIKK